ncbi:MAG TPA: hypothetical protein VGM54_06065 [Chthoniobacter sp.]|jgi:hypothetical protein
MSASTEQLTAQVLALADKDRLAVAAALLKSLKGSPEALNEDVADFVSLARAQEIDEGRIECLGHDEVFSSTTITSTQ